MSSTKRIQITTFIFCLVLGGYIIIACQGFPQAQDSQGFGQGPGFYPQVLAWAMIILGGVCLVNGLRSRRHAAASPDQGQDGTASIDENRPRYGLVASVLVLLIADIIIMQYLGFFVAGFLMVMLMVVLIRPPKGLTTIIKDLVFSAGMVLVVYLVFEVFIQIELPRAGLFS